MSDFAWLPQNMRELRVLDKDRVAIARDHLAGMVTDDRDSAARLLGCSGTSAMLDALFSASPYLTHIILRDPDFFCQCLDEGPDAITEKLDRQLSSSATWDMAEADVMQLLRIFKKRMALLIGWADLFGFWPTMKVTATLSRVADLTVQKAIDHLIGKALQKGDLAHDWQEAPSQNSGYTAIAMGKMGAGELNYSSDIDLVVLFDGEKTRYQGRKTAQELYIRMTKNLVKIMQEITQDGYVFRTDLRLRPDPGATPVAVNILSAEHYYETLGQNWERAAFIKARVCGGDIETGEQFLHHIRPFIWRKFLDFAAIDDIQSIKRQIHAHKGHATIAVAGHNIKVGRGGIREIELFAQTQQLIAGGRHLELRSRETLATLDALVECQGLSRQTCDELSDCYRFLRDIEHRIQMVNDEQSQTLPEGDMELDNIAAMAGFDSLPAFKTALMQCLTTVQGHYDDLFAESETLGANSEKVTGNLVFTGPESDPETLKTLAHMGFTDVQTISDVVRKWHHGRVRATRSARARELLTDLMPTLLDTLSETLEPDKAFFRFDRFLTQLPAGVQLFSLFRNHPELLTLVAQIMGDAPQLAHVLAERPRVLDSLLTENVEDWQDESLANDLDRFLDQAPDYQDCLDIARRWANEHKFQVGAAMLRGAIDALQAGPALGHIADIILSRIVPRVEQEFASKHGRVAGNGLAILAYGKLGGREMSPASDLDLTFVYDCDDPTTESDGPKPLTAALYYNRLSQRIINAISAPTGEGILYEIDMRLRPSGNQGPIAASFETFEKYQKNEAWTWEHQSLVRARIVYGQPAFARKVDTVMQQVLCRPRDPRQTVLDVSEMITRLRQAHQRADLWQIKHHRGGSLELEMLIQMLQLQHADDNPGVLKQHSLEALDALHDGGIINNDHHALFVRALVLYRKLAAQLALAASSGFQPEKAPEGLKLALARLANCDDFPCLESELAEIYTATSSVIDSFLMIEEGN